MDRQDIIVAPATPPGEGGVAIIRISGQGCLGLALPFFKSSKSFSFPESHYLYHGFFCDFYDQRVDEVMFVYMASPRSFTGEDVVEIHCHGGRLTVEKILSIIIQGGARLAKAGEFSFRAFINGRIDLSQAEAIADLIHARSATAQSLAFSQMEGQLSRTLYLFTDKLRDTLALFEAWIDFPEEELPMENLLQVATDIRLIIEKLEELVGGFNTGRFYSEGVSLLLLGKPNVGKSSLMNALLGEERAIVTEIPGTTRDLLEENLVIQGLPIRLIDSAGIRESLEPVEKEGVKRARTRLSSADLVLLLFDSSSSPDDDDRAVLSACSGKKYIVVLTKNDLAPNKDSSLFFDNVIVSVSAKTGNGLSDLRQTIFQQLVGQHARIENSVLLTNQRHQFAANKGIISLRRFLNSLDDGLSLEFLVSDLREALFFLGDITGQTTSEDVLHSIFSRFCIGK